MFDPKEHTNELIQYQGGGYSGCYWEWNFARITDDGYFHDLISTGRDGCSTLEDFQALVERGHSTIFYYDLDHPEDMLEFADENSGFVVVQIAKILWDELGMEIKATCSGCGNEFVVTMGDTHTEPTGRTSADLYCMDCYSMGTGCDLCGEHTDFSALKIEAIMENGSEEVIHDPHLCYYNDCYEWKEEASALFEEMEADINYSGALSADLLARVKQLLEVRGSQFSGDLEFTYKGIDLRLHDEHIVAISVYGEPVAVWTLSSPEEWQDIVAEQVGLPYYVPKEEEYCGRLI